MKAVNAGYSSIKTYLVIFLILASFNGFQMVILEYFRKMEMLENNTQLVINILTAYVSIIAAGITGFIAFLRVNEKTSKVVKLQEAILKTMADMVEYRDNSTGGHIRRSQYKVKLLLNEIKSRGLFNDTVNNWDIPLILQSVQLHDVGKIMIDDQILRKPGPLTNDEYGEMKNHVIYGLNIIEQIEKDSGESDLLKHAKIFALTHHEKWDGSGYPNGLRGEAIPLQGRIMAIADVYDALVSERPYKKAFSHDEAFKFLIKGKGTHFDPVLIDLLINSECAS